MVAVGSGTNKIAYSDDNGETWTAVAASPFATAGLGVAWNGTRWVAVGSGTNEIAYSDDNGETWIVVTSPFTTTGNGVGWNGTIWVAVGSGTNTIAYSDDGIIWTAVTGPSASIFSVGYGVTWNGTRWVAVGSGTNKIAYSSDGITWTGITGPFTSAGRGVAWNAGLAGVFMNTDPLTIDQIGLGLSNKLDIVSDKYYNKGFTNMSLTIKTS
jgi:hypothetical protein